jgi:hypothetical protein
MKKRISSHSLTLTIIYLFVFFFHSEAQIAPNLGAAGKFGILSGNNLTTDGYVYTSGKIGAANSISSTFNANDSTLSNNTGSVPQAISDLNGAILFCQNQSGSVISNTLSGQSLTSGVYEITSNASLSDTINFIGNSNSVFIIKVSGGLTITGNTRMLLNNCKASNIYWIIGGNVNINFGSNFHGVILSSGNISFALDNVGYINVLSASNVTITSFNGNIGQQAIYSHENLSQYLNNPSSACMFTFNGCEYVKNGDFETNTCIPSNFAQVACACFWNDPTGGSSDYLHALGTPPMDIPNSPLFGLQNDQNGGSAYGGLYAYYQPSPRREYLQGELSSSLTSGINYYVEFYCSLSDRSQFEIDRLGLAFSAGAINFPTLYTIPGVTPDISSPFGNMLNDNVNWMRVSGCYVADGTEDHFTIGNFYADNDPSVTIQQVANPPWNAMPSAYYLINGASIVPVEANAGTNQTVACGTQAQMSATTCLSQYAGTTYQWTPAADFIDPTVLNAITIPLITCVPLQKIYTLTVTTPDGSCTVSSQVTVTVTPCSNCFNITKTATPSQTYAGAPVDFAVQICNNTGTGQNVNITDMLPLDFTPTSVNPFPILFLPASPQCQTFHIYGFFSTVGPCNDPSGHINTVTLIQTSSNTNLQATACVDVLLGCPFMLWGTGNCNVGDAVSINLTGHTPVPNIYEMNLDIVYPGFLTAPIDFTNESGQFHSDIIGGVNSITNMGTWTGVPLLTGYKRIRLHIIPQNPISVHTAPNFYGWILKLPFTITSPVPSGQNVFPVFVTSVQSGLYHTDVLDAVGGNQIISGGAWTAANYLMLQGCPGLNPLDASFTMQQVPCDAHGGVTVTANYNAPGIIHNWTWGDNRTTAINGAVTYTYNYLDPICSNTAYNFCLPPYNLPPIAPALPGPYTITHSVIDLVTGVSSTATQQVVIYPACCSATTKILDGSTVSGLGFNNVTGSVDIEGKFYIDQPFTFNNATVTAEPAAEIIVMPANNLDVDHTTISACSNMWTGITVQNDASTRIMFSNLADAQYAVNMNDRSTAYITNNTFERNFVGIYAAESPIDFNNINLFVAENTFKSGSGLVAAFTGQTPSPSQKSFAGMQLYDMVLDLSNSGFQPNIFTDMSNGIVGGRLELDATNCLFSNIIRHANYDNLTNFNGSGVYDRGGHGYFSIRQIGFGKTAAQSTFDNCHYGITGEDINVFSTDNKMTNMDMDYRIDYSSGMNIDILNNYLHSKMNGIDLRYNDNAEHILVEDNEMHFGDPTITATKGHSAIQVIEQNGDNANSVIHHNFIYYNSNSTNARNGIFLNSAANYKVTENTLTMFDNNYNPCGIYSFGSLGPEISCNFVYGSYNNYINKYQSAITITMNDAPTVACNTVDGTVNGIYFSGASYGTDLKGNNIKTHINGIHLDNSAIIGLQKFRGNLWYQPAIGTGLNAVYDNSFNATQFPWKVDPTIVIPGSNPVPMTSSPSGWVTSFPGTNFECSQNGNYCSQIFANGGGTDNFDHQIATGNLQNNPFTDETKWMLKGDLYQKLDDDQSLLTGDATLTNFYNQTQSQLIGQFKDINDANATLFNLDPAVRNNLNQNKQLLQQQMAQLKTYTALLLGGTLTSSQITSTQASITGLQLSISNLITYNKTALDLAKNTRILNADNTKAVNDGLGTSELIEQNEKDIHTIYLATIAKGIFTFTSSQATTILSVAEQCPMSGGRAVPIARGFYEMIDESKTYDDVATCLQGGIVLRHTNEGSVTSETSDSIKKQSVALFKPYFVPNPAKQNATLFYQLDNSKDGILYISNYLGEILLKQVLKANDNSVSISTGSLANGIYHFKVISNGDEIGNGKFAVIK